MIIHKRTTIETATRSSLSNRGYERSEHPRKKKITLSCTPEECPSSRRATPPGSMPALSDIRGCCARPGY